MKITFHLDEGDKSGESFLVEVEEGDYVYTAQVQDIFHDSCREWGDCDQKHLPPEYRSPSRKLCGEKCGEFLQK